MRSTQSYAIRRSSKHCSTCEDLRRLNARIEAALRDARSLCVQAANSSDTATLQNLEEELKQTSVARKLICYAIQTHLTDQHSQACDVRLAA